ncbi:YggS family pyridoxal phosphate-dependent enzyme [Candidatus Pelagibacter bacterium]|jgi:PLP dependent protein|nr:YggS family pyridoxal phosphate-dependent enzyme [Candidatus Pelagibacter bacterium]
MHNSVDKINSIKKEILAKSNKNVNIIAVSKTFPINDILPLINNGHIHFGENKIQEATEKWSDIKKDFEHIQLHMIGKLQTNKVKNAISLFDYIHSLDSLKLAEKISKEQIKQKKDIKIFIQVNIGKEPQKNGVEIDELENFYKICSEKFSLNIIGLMCLPPDDYDANPYFLKIKELNEKLNLKDLSIGMSNDYTDALNYNSTFLRIGSKIFGNRN